MTDPVLYYDPTSEPCRAVHWFAVEADCPVELRYTWLSRGEHRAPELTAANPCQQVPALAHDGFALAEASAIMLYLADIHGKLDAWLGPTPAERARVHQYLSWYHTNLRQRVTCEYFAPVLLRPVYTGDEPPVDADARRSAAQAVLGRIEQFLDPGPYLAGERVTPADILFAADLTALDIAPDREVLLTEGPRLEAWLQAMRQRPGYAPSHRAWSHLVPTLRADGPGERRNPAWVADLCEQVCD